jgi:hypothetical protein
VLFTVALLNALLNMISSQFICIRGACSRRDDGGTWRDVAVQAERFNRISGLAGFVLLGLALWRMA